MKKLILSTILAVFTIGISTAQLTTGEVKYSIEASSTDESMAMATSMMQGSEMSMVFSGEKARTEFNMGSMMSMTVVADGNSDKILMLMGGMMGDIAIPTTTAELEASQDEAETPEVNIELTNDTKNILGYSCKKAILTNEDGVEVIYWYTEEIEVNRTGQRNMNADVPGFPLEFATNQSGLVMSFTATEFSKTLSDKESVLFSTKVPEGYKVMTMKELTSMGM